MLGQVSLQSLVEGSLSSENATVVHSSLKPADLKEKTDSAILYIKTAIIGRRLLFLVSPILSFSLRPGGELEH